MLIHLCMNADSGHAFSRAAFQQGGIATSVVPALDYCGPFMRSQPQYCYDQPTGVETMQRGEIDPDPANV